MEKLIKLKEQRMALVKKGREIQESAENRAKEEKRERPEFTAEERNQLDKIMIDVRELGKQIKDEETLLEASGEGREFRGQDPGETPEGNAEERAFAHYLTTGERRDGLVAGVVADGGALAPQAFYAKLWKDIDAAFPLLSRVDYQELKGAKSLGTPQLTADVSDADWTAEVASPAISPDDEATTALREVDPKPLAKLVKVSKKFLNAAALGGEAVVRQRLAHKFAKAFENGLLNGTGSGQPLGIFTASASGVPTSRDVTADNATSITYDDVVNLKRKVAGKYTNKILICHEDFVTKCMLLKDSNGRPLWIDGFANGEPPRLINLQYHESEVAPNTFAASQYVAAVGDLSFYLWAQSNQVEVQVLMELFSLTNQIGFKGYAEADGAPMVPEAFARLKMAAA